MNILIATCNLLVINLSYVYIYGLQLIFEDLSNKWIFASGLNLLNFYNRNINKKLMVCGDFKGSESRRVSPVLFY